MTSRTYTAFVDGACLNNGTNIARAGWGVLLRNAAGETLELAGPLAGDHHTNQRAELSAAIEALKALKNPAQVDLHTDSTYVVNGINQWLAGWKARGWRKSDKKPVENIDLWQALDAPLGQHSVTAHWVKGHSGHAENERADALAGHAAQFQKAHRKRTPAVEAPLV
ncbi:ribonuclease HI [Pseudomonas sp. ML96]|uniref:ribonuclease HI n=1 Tax=Pseudomonas sp. ML96 TaxID=1523503 RepID=UPI0006901623|nr:ribonuclease HI [Pseudomonas sp. ML96]